MRDRQEKRSRKSKKWSFLILVDWIAHIYGKFSCYVMGHPTLASYYPRPAYFMLLIMPKANEQRIKGVLRIFVIHPRLQTLQHVREIDSIFLFHKPNVVLRLRMSRALRVLAGIAARGGQPSPASMRAAQSSARETRMSAICSPPLASSAQVTIKRQCPSGGMEPFEQRCEKKRSFPDLYDRCDFI